MAGVCLRNVTKTYDGLAAVRDFNLDVREGEFVVLLGPSGCGKTTTLRMIAGFVEPTGGSIFIGDDEVTYLPPRRRNIGMVFQDYALFPNMNVAENIAFGLRERRAERSRIQQRVSELLDLVRLPGKAESYIDELSGGQQQRVALARALAVDPRVLLMDEPLGALDLKLREAMQLELKRLQQELQITTVLVTHDQQEAMTLSDRIVIMAEGEIQQVGTPRELYTTPKNKFVADFIGKNNILHGRIVEVSEAVLVAELADGVRVSIPAAESLSRNQTIELSVRPEQLELATSETCDRLNRLKGVVESKTFLGNVFYYFVRLPWGPVLLVERSAGTVQAEIGDHVCLSWTPDSAVWFPAHGQPTGPVAMQ
jgi:spermidine/putrescine ABC transporter ATP-binding subunit